MPIARYEAEFDWDWTSIVVHDYACAAISIPACLYVPLGTCDGVTTDGTEIIYKVFDTAGTYKSELVIYDANCNPPKADTVTITVENYIKKNKDKISLLYQDNCCLFWNLCSEFFTGSFLERKLRGICREMCSFNFTSAY